jgi:DUF1016 N-terminal domain
MSGLSRSNLHYMRAFAAGWPEIVPQAAEQLPWGQIRELLDKLDDLNSGNGMPSRLSRTFRRPDSLLRPTGIWT